MCALILIQLIMNACKSYSLLSSFPSPLLFPPPPVQVSEHFRDFDPLRSGSISCSHFRQGLTFIGQSSLSHSEFTALCEAFRDPRKKDHVLWKEFLARVDRGVCVCVCVCVCMRRVCGVRVHACLCGHVCLTYHNVHATTLPTELEFTEASLCRMYIC